MKKILSVLLCAAVLFTLCACSVSDIGSGNAAAVVATYAPTVSNGPGVCWLNTETEADAALQQLAADYTAATGVPVTIVTVAADGFDAAMASGLDTMDAPTLFTLDASGVENYRDYLYDLSGSAFLGDELTDAFNVTDEDEAVLAAPVNYACAGMLVDKEKLDEAGYYASSIRDLSSLATVADGIAASAKKLGFTAFTTADAEQFAEYYGGVLLNDSTVQTGLKAAWDLWLADGVTGSETAAAEQFAAGEAVFTLGTSDDYAALAAEEAAEEAAEAAAAEPTTTPEPTPVPETEDGEAPDDSEVVEGVEYRYGMLPLYTGSAGDNTATVFAWAVQYFGVNKEADYEDILATMDFLYWLVTDANASATLTEIYGVLPYSNTAVSSNRFLADANVLLAAGRGVMTPASDDAESWLAELTQALQTYASTDVTDTDTESEDAPEPWEAVDAVLSAHP